MTEVLLATGAGDESLAPNRVPIELRIEDSLKSIAAPIRGVSVLTVGVMVGSLVVHGLLMTAALVTARASVAPPHQEIAVEIVQDAPKPAPPPPAKAATKPPATAKPPAPPKIQQAKLEAPKPAQAKPEATKVEPPKPVAPKVQAVAQPAKPPVDAKPADAKPTEAKPTDAKELDALEKELADLRAQQAELKTQAAAQNPPSETSHPGPVAGLQAVALPSVGDSGEVVGYEDLVFSQLAKAKGIGAWRGPAGTTGVHFEVDAAGRLLRAEVAVSSGNATLDTEALAIVHRAAPFPPPPKDGEHSFFANVNFMPPKRS